MNVPAKCFGLGWEVGRFFGMAKYHLWMIASSIVSSLVLSSLGGSPRCNWGSKLVKSENLMSLDYESFRDFLTDTYFTDHNPKLAFDVASAWLTHKSAPKSATKSEVDLGKDMDLSDAPLP